MHVFTTLYKREPIWDLEADTDYPMLDEDSRYEDLYEIPFSAVHDYLKYLKQHEFMEN